MAARLNRCWMRGRQERAAVEKLPRIVVSPFRSREMAGVVWGKANRMVHAIDARTRPAGPRCSSGAEAQGRRARPPARSGSATLAVGLNFIDVYYRKGVYPPPGGYPLIPGAEAAGEVEAVGPGVTGLKPGDRIVYQVHVGAYAEKRLLQADRAVKLPTDSTRKSPPPRSSRGSRCNA